MPGFEPGTSGFQISNRGLSASSTHSHDGSGFSLLGRMVTCSRYAPMYVHSVHLPPPKMELNVPNQHECLRKETSEGHEKDKLFFAEQFNALVIGDQGGARLLLATGFNDLVIAIYDDEPTSIIAFALTSREYHAHISEKMADKSIKEARRYGSDAQSMHVEVPFDHNSSAGKVKVKYKVTCYFARQFETLRKKCCSMELNFIRSLCRCKKWGAQGGKSDVFFAKTSDDIFIIKQVTETELEYFIKCAPEYFEYISDSLSRGSLTCVLKTLGIYKVTAEHVKGVKETNLMVMENLLFGRNVTPQYALNGSARSRYNSDSTGSSKVLLDQKFSEHVQTSPIYVGNEVKRLLEIAVRNDTKFLASINVKDYLLLVRVDEERRELVLSITDYLRQYTWDEHLETWVKTLGALDFWFACSRYATIHVHSVHFPPAKLEFNNPNQEWPKKEALEGEARLLLDTGFNDIDITISDDNVTRIMAYVLNSREYHDHISDEVVDKNKQEVRSHGSDAKEMHVDVSFCHESPARKVKYKATCYHAKQFDALRKKCCSTELDFIQSLCRCKKWGAQGGKSNVFFAKTLDDRFIIKQVTKTELNSFNTFAPVYFKYLSDSLSTGSPTCLAKILGIYQVTAKNVKGGKERRMDLMVMENLLFGRNVTRQYDLKGSTWLRYNQDSTGSNKVLLDQNLLEIMPTSPIFVGSKAKQDLEDAIRNDTKFLASINVMDYSLLVGVDEERHELVLGIIDYMRQYTWDKRLETWVKAHGILGGPKNTAPTVISPAEYKKRFEEAMSEYFPMFPGQMNSTYGNLLQFSAKMFLQLQHK